MNASMADFTYGLSQKILHPRVVKALAQRLTMISPPLKISDVEQPKQGLIKRREIKCE